MLCFVGSPPYWDVVTNVTRVSLGVIWNGKRKPKGPDADEPCTASTLTLSAHPPHFLGTVLTPVLVRTAAAVILLPFSDETLKLDIARSRVENEPFAGYVRKKICGVFVFDKYY
jgi:hypothetical protein